jgi:hypothetical protein
MSAKESVDSLFDRYLDICNSGDPETCGDLVESLDDNTCKELYDRLAADERTNQKLVKPLLYNYQTQKFRW